MTADKLKSPAVVGGALVFAGALALYLMTVAPSLTFGWRGYGIDGGELLAAAYGWGVPHPPGYPTYTILLKVFGSIFPVGDFAFRGNVMSALLASTAVTLIYATALRIGSALAPGAPTNLRAATAALGAAVVAASPLFWSQAVITEVYALNSAFGAALLYLAARVSLAPDSDGVPDGDGHRDGDAAAGGTLRRDLALYGLMLGLGLGNHLTLIAVAIPTLYWMAASRGWRTLVTPWLIGPGALGAAVYVYLPIASSADPAIDWGNASGPGGLGWMISGRPYQSYVFGVPVATLPSRLLAWLEFIFIQFNPLGIFIGLLGVWSLRTALPHLAYALVGIIGLVSLYTLSYNAFDFQVFMLPAFMTFGLLIGIGLLWLASDWLPRAIDAAPLSERTRVDVLSYNPVFFLVTVVFVLLPVIGIALNYSGQDLSEDRAAISHGERLIGQLPTGAVLFTKEETDAFPLWYVSLVEQPERDVALVVTPLLQFEWYAESLRETYGDRIPQDLPLDIDAAVAAIADLNLGRAAVYSTYSSAGLIQSFQVVEINGIYRLERRSP